MIKDLDLNKEFYEIDANKNVINFVFKIDNKKEDTVKKNLMLRMISNYTNNYRTIKEYIDARDRLYIMNYGTRIINFKDNFLLFVSFIIPKENLLNEFSLEDAIKYMYDVIFNPIVNNNMFEEDAFNLELNYLKDSEKDYPHSIKEFVSDTFLDFADEDNKTLIHYSEYLDLLNSVTNKDVYEYYLKNIKNNDYKVYIFGSNDDKDNLLKLLDKYFVCKNKSLKIDLNDTDFFKPVEYKENIINIKYNQSVLNLLYQFKDLTHDDLIKLEMLYYFMNSKENDLLYTNLRYKKNLIYTAAVKYSLFYGVIGIIVFFDYNNLNNIEESISEVFDQMKNKDNYEVYKERLIRAIEYDVLDDMDNPFSLINEVFKGEFTPNDLFKVKLEYMKNVSFESFNEFLNRIILTRKLVMKSGEEND